MDVIKKNPKKTISKLDKPIKLNNQDYRWIFWP